MLDYVLFSAFCFRRRACQSVETLCFFFFCHKAVTELIIAVKKKSCWEFVEKVVECDQVETE